MTAPVNPAIDAFNQDFGPEKIWGEVLIRRAGSAFTLCHAADRDVQPTELRTVSVSELRRVAMYTGTGQYRPLHASPDLARGWMAECGSMRELWRGLQELYPGSVPDWFAVRSGKLPVTNYREFTDRQTGMYRITQMLTDEQAANVTRAACHPRFCLKQRLWTVPGLEVDSRAGKSEIPCLEPCAMLLELARKSMRIEQEEKVPVQLSRSELESLLVATEVALSNGLAGERVGNFGSATNPRRLQLLLEKLKQEVSPATKPEAED